MKRFAIEYWADDSVGCGWRLYYHGELVGTAGNIWQLRRWARQIWRGVEDGQDDKEPRQ